MNEPKSCVKPHTSTYVMSLCDTHTHTHETLHLAIFVLHKHNSMRILIQMNVFSLFEIDTNTHTHTHILREISLKHRFGIHVMSKAVEKKQVKTTQFFYGWRVKAMAQAILQKTQRKNKVTSSEIALYGSSSTFFFLGFAHIEHYTQ